MTKKDKIYSRKTKYADMLMQHNRDNPNISEAQADFLQKLAQYRHLLHASPQQYFFNTKKTVEIDQFFALAHSQNYFERMNLPFPKDIFDIMSRLQDNKNMQYSDFDKSIEQFAFNKEAINSLIERYLQRIDDEKNTLYCPHGHTRDTTQDPVKLTMAKLKQGKKEISSLQQRIIKKLEAIDRVPEGKLIQDNGLDL